MYCFHIPGELAITDLQQKQARSAHTVLRFVTTSWLFAICSRPLSTAYQAPATSTPLGSFANSATMSDHSITLAGSADMVTEFFAYGVNALLYQRGIYPPETFSRVQKYGMTMLVSTDPAVKSYLNDVLNQMKAWLNLSALRRVVVVVASVATGEVRERWAFDVKVTEEAEDAPEKEDRVILGEIQAIIRQITASVSFLPLLDEACAFDMLIYTNQDTETPARWEESGPRIIKERDEVKLRSFSTSVHSVEASVTYARPRD